MEHQARLSIVRKMQVLALELGQLADRSGPSFGRADLEAGSPWFDGLSLLTPREHEVLRALTFGASTERIGELLGVTTSTVRSHVKSVLAKLGVHSRIEAVALLVRRDTHLDKPA
ncbi:MAG TPA: helix-turn-helix transcriptional regulator [Actinomycetota bacterium]